MKKQIVSTLLAAVLIFSLLPVTASAESGTCGEGVTWTLENGTLTISGTGAMADFLSMEDIPWCDHQSDITSAVIEDGITGIGIGAFAYCDNLTSLTIPDSVTSIGDDAICCCTSLTTVTIPDSVTSIGNAAFASCTSLTSITIPDGVTSIGNAAFLNCTSLTSVTIPGSVTGIDETAFYRCASLTDVYYGGTEEQWNEIDISANNDPLTCAEIHCNSSNTIIAFIKLLPEKASGWLLDLAGILFGLL